MRQWFLKSSPDILGGDHGPPGNNDRGGHRKGSCKHVRAGCQGRTDGPDGPLTLDEWREKCQEIAEICKAYPGRLYGSATSIPTIG